MAYQKDGQHYTNAGQPTHPVKPNDELDKILVNVQSQKLSNGLGAPTSHVRQEAKSAINSLTLKQVLELIGEDEDELNFNKKLRRTEYGNIYTQGRNRLRAELRQSAERIWKT